MLCVQTEERLLTAPSSVTIPPFLSKSHKLVWQGPSSNAEPWVKWNLWCSLIGFHWGTESWSPQSKSACMSLWTRTTLDTAPPNQRKWGEIMSKWQRDLQRKGGPSWRASFKKSGFLASHIKEEDTTFYQRCFVNQVAAWWDWRGLEFVHGVKVKFSKRDTTKPYEYTVP